VKGVGRCRFWRHKLRGQTGFAAIGQTSPAEAAAIFAAPPETRALGFYGQRFLGKTADGKTIRVKAAGDAGPRLRLNQPRLAADSLLREQGRPPAFLS